MKQNLQIGDMTKRNRLSGFSLMEIVVVLAIIGVIGTITTASLVSTLRGTHRVDSESKVKQNLEFTLNVIDRHLRNSRSVECISATRVDYIDQTFSGGSFYLGSRTVSGQQIGYLASGSASVKLTGPEVNITAVSFTCTQPNGNLPASIRIDITGEDAVSTGVEKATSTVSTRVYLRSNL